MTLCHAYDVDQHDVLEAAGPLQSWVQGDVSVGQQGMAIWPFQPEDCTFLMNIEIGMGQRRQTAAFLPVSRTENHSTCLLCFLFDRHTRTHKHMNTQDSYTYNFL